MIVEGAIVMVENIVRLLSHPGPDAVETVPQKISRAAFEVQRPVFYSILIIIVAYVPIFTLQAVEGRLFKPMAWTVAFALLGALLFSLFVGPVLASLVYPKGTKEWHNPLMGFLTRSYAWALGIVDSLAVGHAGAGGSYSGRHHSCWLEPSVLSFFRIWTKARFGCAAPWRPAPDLPKASASRIRFG